MFTGLIEECGQLTALTHTTQGARLIVRATLVSQGVQIGDSIAVNGCCLTVCAYEGESLEFDLLRETLERTNLGALSPGGPVNLERALAVGGRLGGHFVQGHIDGTSTVLSFEPVGADHRLEVALPSESARYVAFKGSIAIDGISLTVAEVCESSFVVWLIPHTLAATNLHSRRPGAVVNLEFDLLAKYVERLISR
ncbi:MAG: riboflavin synthase, alpha subunit [Chthoniobacteraceae bacterium]|nr:riboflavin synthase, alpha subunit [Chthoniobacteraceae bacterium]